MGDELVRSLELYKRRPGNYPYHIFPSYLKYLKMKWKASKKEWEALKKGYEIKRRKNNA